jgi:hypothetical protein
MTNRNRSTIGAALLLWLLLFPVSLGAAASIMFNVAVPSGKWKTTKLKNLPKGATVAVRIESTGSLVVALVNSRGYTKVSRPLFAGQMEKDLSFAVEIPKTDDYFLVLDNRKGTQSRKVTITVQATGPPRMTFNPSHGVIGRTVQPSRIVPFSM